MSKKTVIKADLIGKACKSDILSTVAKVKGIKSMEIDPDKCTLTVVGAVDPVRIARKLRKACFAATIVSVEDDKPKEEKKDPCKEACEKLCKEKCGKLACCKECKDKCEKECKDKCEKRCKEWLDKGCCSCGCGGATSSGISYTLPCTVPSSYPYYYYGSSGGGPYGGRVYCYEEGGTMHNPVGLAGSPGVQYLLDG